ncbi:fumarylacetoacetate hydrolase [Thozetella sp. PMI_491]|nr:fumarylacetoacetate hydrolase [Thozetella sp. PMI_491]
MEFPESPLPATWWHQSLAHLSKHEIWKRFFRFISDDGETYAGEPVDSGVDVGLVVKDGKSAKVRILSSTSALDEQAEFTCEERLVKEILSPLSAGEVGTIRCIGVNYNGHGAELDFAVPPVPIVFLKPKAVLNDPSAPIIVPSFAKDADFEVELCVFIDKECKNVLDEALSYVLGYTTSNDFSHEKGFDRFAPMGPARVHASLIPDPQQLEMRSTLNGKDMQHATLDTMIFPVARIVSHLPQASTLPAGTIILTGTPGGIGNSRNPPIYLQEGDDLRLRISGGLGTICNPIMKDKSNSTFNSGLL